MHQGYQFKIDREDEGLPVHRPLYKTSPFELEEAKKQIQSTFEHGFIRPSDSPYGTQFCSSLKRMKAFGFALTTID